MWHLKKASLLLKISILKWLTNDDDDDFNDAATNDGAAAAKDDDDDSCTRRLSRTLTSRQRIIPVSWRSVARGNTRGCWWAIQTMTNRTREVTLRSIMITTAAHAQGTSWGYRQRCAIDYWWC